MVGTTIEWYDFFVYGAAAALIFNKLIFGQKWLGGLGGVSFISQLIGTALAIAIALAGGFIVYGILKATIGIRLSQEDEFRGADLSIHKISANSEEGMF